MVDCRLRKPLPVYCDRCASNLDHKSPGLVSTGPGQPNCLVA